MSNIRTPIMNLVAPIFGLASQGDTVVDLDNLAVVMDVLQVLRRNTCTHRFYRATQAPTGAGTATFGSFDFWSNAGSGWNDVIVDGGANFFPGADEDVILIAVGLTCSLGGNAITDGSFQALVSKLGGSAPQFPIGKILAGASANDNSLRIEMNLPRLFTRLFLAPSAGLQFTYTVTGACTVQAMFETWSGPQGTLPILAR